MTQRSSLVTVTRKIMSKGLGWVERQVSRVLDANPEGIRPRDIVRKIRGDATTSEFVAIRRALSSMRRKELAFRIAVPYSNSEYFQQHYWTSRDHAISKARALTALPNWKRGNQILIDDVRAALTLIGKWTQADYEEFQQHRLALVEAAETRLRAHLGRR